MNTRHAPPSVGLRCLLAGVAGLVMLGLASGASAQDIYSMADQLNQLQREVADLQRQVFAGGGASAGSAVGGGSAAAAGQEVRLQQMDEQVRNLTGQVEQLSYTLQQLTTKLDKLAGDVDFRLNALEQGGVAGGENPPQVAGPAGGATAGGGTAPGTAPPPGAKSMVLGTLTQSQLKANQPPPDAGQTAALPPPAVALPGNTPEEKYNYAWGLLRQNKYAEAEQALRTFVQQYPTDKWAGNAQFWIGESFYVRHNYNEAAIAYAEAYQKYPNNVKAPQNLLKLGMSLTQMGRKSDACKAFDQLGRQYPDASADIKVQTGRARVAAGCPGN
jgi:tol-pal system protein YbgF